jgi:hypothetical protein
MKKTRSKKSRDTVPLNSTVMNSQGNSSRIPSSSEQQVGKKLNTFLLRTAGQRTARDVATVAMN